MVLRINDIAPDFSAQTTQGQISFHDWLEDSWGVLFSHPKDFTPVCTTELGALAGLQDEFARRDVKVIGLSVDPASDHARWLTDIGDVTGHVPAYPMSTGRNFAELLRVIDSLQLTAGHKVATPADWQKGDDVIILPAVSDAEAERLFPDGWETVKPYLRRVTDPSS